ncbi:nucleoside hydrolase [Stieleria sp. JC731]|uniref:nucleoside hydrolase n=1 Tax=Pirellulaceae TaxID=2691357 RepID=UPI001E57023E|nr:nucleoside hydrolase [Stieleria sp. JC731]MCC9601346.1 nucleoside hydrolase [Stieleria sp. JC731]
MNRRLGLFAFLIGILTANAYSQADIVLPAQDKTPVPVVFDTDITGDCDDVLALAMLHALEDRGECELKAVTISKINTMAAPFVDAVNTFYGRPDIPIGATRDAQRRTSRYLDVCKVKDGQQLRYPHDVQTSDDVPSAVSVLRKVLAESEDNALVIIQVGLASNLAELLQSPPDEISPLNGSDLLRQKCKLISVMAGSFGPVMNKDRHPEANVINGIDAMQRFAKLCPEDVPVVWSEFRIGLAAPYPRESIARDFAYREHHIVREAYLLHSGPNHDRPTWDLTSVLYAVRADDNYFDLSETGKVTVDDEGYTEFKPGKDGRDRLLTMDERQAVRVIEVQRALSSQPPCR